MRLPLSVVLLVASSVGLQLTSGVQQGGDSIAYQDNLGVNEADSGDLYTRMMESFATSLVKDHRKRRAFTTFFQAWKALLKTTFAFRKTFDTKIPEKTFLKIGSLDDAVSDFYSLGPSKISNRPGLGLQGIVDDKVLVYLRYPDNFPPTIGLMDAKNAPRMIVYFENVAKAKSSVRDLNMYTFRQ